MPTWGALLGELNLLIAAQQATGAPPKHGQPSPHDVIRRKYLRALADHTGRPAIVYASGWLEGRPAPDPSLVSVSTKDIMGFMEAVHDLPRGAGLDLVLHSPGGESNAAEAIMQYLRDQGFDNIRAIVPVAAMSAATMMALSCDEIVMGRHSQLGPIDPQFTLLTPEGPRSAPAQSILDQFELAKKECAATPEALAAWLPILRGYGPGLLTQCLTSQELAEETVCKAMERHMFAGDADANTKAKAIAEWFNDHKTHGSHGRALRFEEVASKGVRLVRLEDDQKLQDAVLSAWHAVQLTLSGTAMFKLIESSMGKTWLLSGSLQLLLGGAPGAGVGGGRPVALPPNLRPRPSVAPTPTAPLASPNRPSRSQRRSKGK
jgi:hypothetical protein